MNQTIRKLLLIVIAAISLSLFFCFILFVWSTHIFPEFSDKTDKKLTWANESEYESKVYIWEDLDLTQINYSSWKYFHGRIYDVFYDPMICSFDQTPPGERKNCIEGHFGYIPVEKYPYKTTDDELWKWHLLVNNKICPDNHVGLINPVDGNLDCYLINELPIKGKD